VLLEEETPDVQAQLGREAVVRSPWLGVTGCLGQRAVKVYVVEKPNGRIYLSGMCGVFHGVSGNSSFLFSSFFFFCGFLIWHVRAAFGDERQEMRLAGLQTTNRIEILGNVNGF
jgi:hypothetical protein